MAKAITVRNVPDEVRDELAARAARAGQSMQEYVWELLVDAASQPVPVDLINQIREHARASGKRVDSATVLADLEADRR